MIGDNPNDTPRPENELIDDPTPKVAGTYFREWEFFRTESRTTDEGTIPYPAEDDTPNTYYARQLKNVKYAKEQGSPALTYDLTDRFVFIKNMARSGNYLPEFSVVIGFEKSGLWYTVDDQKGVANDRGMIAYTFGSYVVVLDDADGSIVWGPTLITHERYPAHPDAAYWELYRGGWQTGSGTAVAGMTYLRALRCKFDRGGNLYVAFDLIECVDASGAGISGTSTGAVVTSGMVRFDYDLEQRTFSKNWQSDVSKWFTATPGLRLLSALGLLNTSLQISTWAAFDISDDGYVWFGAFGWQADADADNYVEHTAIATAAHYTERYSTFAVDTTLQATWLVKLAAATGDQVRRFVVTDVAGDTLPAGQKLTGSTDLLCYPVWLSDVRVMGNGRIMLNTRAIGSFGYLDAGRQRSTENTATGQIAIQEGIMQIDDGGIWRDRGSLGGINSASGAYDPRERLDDARFEWALDPTSGTYYVRAIVVGEFLGAGTITTGPSDDCKAACSAESSTARRLARACVLIRQETTPGSPRAWQQVYVDPAAGPVPCNYVAFTYCNWLRSGTDGFPIVGRFGHTVTPANSCDLHGGRGLLSLTNGVRYLDSHSNTRESFNLWLSESLGYQPLPAVNQLESYYRPSASPTRSGFLLFSEGRYENFVRYDSNDDTGAGDGAAVWGFGISARTFFDVADLIERRDRVYKVDQAGNVVWSALGDERNPTHDLYSSGGSVVQFMPVAGEGIGTSIDVYDPRENPDSPAFDATFVGRRFVPPIDDQEPPRPPDVS